MLSEAVGMSLVSEEFEIFSPNPIVPLLKILFF